METLTLETPLLRLSDRPQDVWKLRDAFEGALILGGIGSGKTSGSGKKIALKLLENGFGGLVLTVKPDETDLWLDYIKRAGREKDLIIFGLNNGSALNFLDYELNRGGAGAGSTNNIVNLFYTVLESADRAKSGGGKAMEAYWQNALKQLLRNAIDLIAIVEGRLSLKAISDLIRTAPLSEEQMKTDEWQKRYCNRLVQKVVEKDGKKELSAVQISDARLCLDYWLNEFPNLSEKTRSIIVSSFTGFADVLLRGEYSKLFCGETTVTPEATHEGKIVLMDLNVKEYMDAGRYAQLIFKLLWQQATERRVKSAKLQERDFLRPVFLWADECQEFFTSEDAGFQATARSARACTVYITQNLPNLYRILNNKHEVDAFLGNLATKIFHANADVSTNEYAANTLGKEWLVRRSSGVSSQAEQKGSQFSFNESESYDFLVPPIRFAMLKKGGEENDFKVEGYFFQNGRAFYDEDLRIDVPYLPVLFSQR